MERVAYSVDEVAQLLGVSRGHAFAMVHQGRLRAVRFGKRLLIPVRAVEELLAERVGTEPAVALRR